jgi:hypothetical protein
VQLLLTAFESVHDPRAGNVRHQLVGLLLIGFLAVPCGTTGDVGMQPFGGARLDSLWRCLEMSILRRGQRRVRSCLRGLCTRPPVSSVWRNCWMEKPGDDCATISNASRCPTAVA